MSEILGDDTDDEPAATMRAVATRAAKLSVDLSTVAASCRSRIGNADRNARRIERELRRRLPLRVTIEGGAQKRRRASAIKMVVTMKALDAA